jgi:Flp pilus assembly protein TadD
MIALDFSPFARGVMNRFLAGISTIALCAVWTSGCASMETASKAPDAPAVAESPTVNASQDTATIEKSLPTDLPGEIERAHLLRTRGAYEDAARALAQLMLVAPDNPQVVGEYGKTLLQEGRARESVDFLKRAAQISPNDWTIYSAMGVAFDQAGDHADAKTAYQRALALKPGEPSVLNNLAVSRALAGDVSGAKTILAQASQTGASEPKIANNLAAVDAMQKPATSAKLVTPAAQAPAAAPKPITNMATKAPTPMLPQTVTQPSLAQAAPRKLASTNAAETTADEKKLGAGVVMQAVPVDHEAGPVHASQKLADAKPAKKPVEKHAPPTKLADIKPAPKAELPAPALRTASGAN